MVEWEALDDEGPDIVESAPSRLRPIAASLGSVLRRRPRLTLVVALSVAVLMTVVGVVASRTPVNPALAQTTNVPRSLLAAAHNARGSYQPSPIALVGVPPLSADGKPELVYTGTENCPDCATVNWALVVALSRFGTLSGMREIRSQAVGVLRADDTWSFTRASYDSSYLSLTVAATSPETGGTHLAAAFIASSDDAALDFANRSVWSGPLFPPNLLADRSWNQIAALLREPGGRPVLAAADNIIAAICRLTHDQPATACG